MADVTVTADVDSILQAADIAAVRTLLGVAVGDSPTFTDLTLSGGSIILQDAKIERDAANIAGLRNGVNACKWRVFHTYTDASNHQGLELRTGANAIEVFALTAGTGEDNIDVKITPAGTGLLCFGTHAAVTAETVTGFITIKDAAGTPRKIAVVS